MISIRNPTKDFWLLFYLLLLSASREAAALTLFKDLATISLPALILGDRRPSFNFSALTPKSWAAFAKAVAESGWDWFRRATTTKI